MILCIIEEILIVARWIHTVYVQFSSFFIPALLRAARQGHEHSNPTSLFRPCYDCGCCCFLNGCCCWGRENRWCCPKALSDFFKTQSHSNMPKIFYKIYQRCGITILKISWKTAKRNSKMKRIIGLQLYLQNRCLGNKIAWLSFIFKALELKCWQIWSRSLVMLRVILKYSGFINQKWIIQPIMK